MDFNVPAMIHHHGRARGEHPVLIHGEEALTYLELEQQICRWANHFSSDYA